MPNFDQFERLTRRALSIHESPVQPYAAEMSRLPQDELPNFARNLSNQEIIGWLTRAREALVSMFPKGERFFTSENNSLGKDLVAQPSMVEIELKSPDGKTDANVGVKQIAWCFDDQADDTLKSIMIGNMNQRISKWRKLAPELRDGEMSKSKELQRQELLRYFSQRVTVGEPAPPRLAHFAWAVSVGFTKSDEVIRTFGTTATKPPLLLCADLELGLKTYEQSFIRTEKVIVEKLSSEPATSRVQLLLRGRESGQTCLIYPHYKNSFHEGDLTIPAKFWVKTPCFHIWIGR